MNLICQDQMSRLLYNYYSGVIALASAKVGPPIFHLSVVWITYNVFEGQENFFHLLNKCSSQQIIGDENIYRKMSEAKAI